MTKSRRRRNAGSTGGAEPLLRDHLAICPGEGPHRFRRRGEREAQTAVQRKLHPCGDSVVAGSRVRPSLKAQERAGTGQHVWWQRAFVEV